MVVVVTIVDSVFEVDWANALLVRSAHPATTVITTVRVWFCCRPAAAIGRVLQCVGKIHIAIASCSVQRLCRRAV
jgi:hypothetical protein